MTLAHGPSIVTDNLYMLLDAANPRSYPGSGSTWYDISGNNNHLTLYNSPAFMAAPAAISFNSSSSQYATIASVNVTSQFTMSLAVLPVAGQIGAFFYTYNGLIRYTPYLTGSAGLYFVANTSASLSSYTSGQYNIIDVVATPNPQIYVNGVQKTSGTAGALVSGTANFSLAAELAPSASNYSTMSVGRFAWYNAALTSAQIAQNFNAIRGRYGL